jgi:lysophospholipase L1-like esterase
MTSEFLRHAVIIVAGATIALLSAASGILAQERDCTVPERFYTFEPLLTKTAKALAGGRAVVIVSLGGSSTLGLAAGKTELAWPARLASALEAKFPPANVKMVDLSVARQTAKRAAERLDHDVLTLKPTLVIWETGTMEAVRGTNIDEFRKTLQAGISEVRTAKSELMLMNMQFSRDTDAIIGFEPYLSAMNEIADANDVPLFRRHGIMRYWAENGSLDLRVTDPEKRRQVAAKLYDCIGRAVADFITRGVPPPKPAHGADSNR